MKWYTITAIVFLLIFILVGAGVLTWLLFKREPAKACTSDSDCTSKQFCSNGTCLNYGECVHNTDCLGSQICNNGICVQCASSSDCKSNPGKNACNADHRCVQCVTSKDCTSGICDTQLNVCIECENDSDCPSGKCWEPDPKKPTLNQCVQCLNDEDCPGRNCINHACVNNDQNKEYFPYKETSTNFSTQNPQDSFRRPPAIPPVMNLGPPLSTIETKKPKMYNQYRSYW